MADDSGYTDEKPAKGSTQYGQTRTHNEETVDPEDRRLSRPMKIALFVTIGAVFIVGPCIALLVFGGLVEFFEMFGIASGAS